MKSEPDVYSILDLQREHDTIWDGVRNYQARNFLRQMKLGDLAFFYHSNSTPPGIVGLMKIVKTDVVDLTQFEPTSKYYDPKSTSDSPRWHTVTVQFVEAFPEIISLATLKEQFTADDLLLVRPGNRLSVMPICVDVANRILVYR
ncbi:EVE domain-containing protein [Anabaena sp. FACHB-1237]|nr:EVE domain-containing protein [Anabaena sp. FACHB-1237]